MLFAIANPYINELSLSTRIQCTRKSVYRLVGFLRSRVFDEGIDSLRSRRPNVVGGRSNPFMDSRIFCQKPRQGRMADYTFPRLPKDVLRHGMAEDTASNNFVQAAARGNLLESRFLIDREA